MTLPSPPPPAWARRLIRMRPPRCAAVVMVAIGAVGMSALAVMFAAILDNVLDGEGIVAVDKPLTTWIAAHRNNQITSALRVFTQLGSPLTLLVVMAIVAAGVAASGRSAVPLGVGALAIGGFGLSVVIVKLVVGRPRPPLPLATMATEGYSFPSGHATGISVVGIISTWLLIRRWIRSRAGQVAAWIFVSGVIAAVGFSRIYLGVHYLSDVIAGWTLGALWAGVLIAATELWEARPSRRAPRVDGAAR
jgi:membrane-associated phospholipid phosphatase